MVLWNFIGNFSIYYIIGSLFLYNTSPVYSFWHVCTIQLISRLLWNLPKIYRKFDDKKVKCIRVFKIGQKENNERFLDSTIHVWNLLNMLSINSDASQKRDIWSYYFTSIILSIEAEN